MIDRLHYEKTLETYIQENDVAAKLYRFETICHSVAQAAASAKAPIEQFIKNICLTNAVGTCFIAIMRGTDRASISTIARLLGEPTLRLASSDEVLSLTGYPAGGTPSFGYSAHFLMDTKVMELSTVWTGGGSEYALVQSTASDLQRTNQAQIAKLRK